MLTPYNYVEREALQIWTSYRMWQMLTVTIFPSPFTRAPQFGKAMIQII